MRHLSSRLFTASLGLAAAISIPTILASHHGALSSLAPTVHAATTCPANDAGLKLPPGFCATIFADGIGHSRHLAVSDKGVVYVNTWSGDYFPAGEKVHEGGFLVALQDSTGSGKADIIRRFGPTAEDGSHGGTGIYLYDNHLYAEMNDSIIRMAIPGDGAIVPTGAPETVVSGLPLGGDHPMHPFYISEEGELFIDIATATNACQEKNRTLHSPGLTPCEELKTRGGIWRYNAKQLNQTFSPAERYATGIRNAEGFGIDKANHKVYITQHGRDQLHANWPELYKPTEEATLPSEEVLLLKDQGDYGWPTCYYDPGLKHLVLAPEYGGDGKKAGMCSDKTGPFAAFPAHWGPNGMVFYDQKQFPAAYHNGLFIAFHGSWDRAPYAQSGYNIVFQGITKSGAPGRCEIFADGFAGATTTPEGAVHRPSGIAEGPDGSLYVADDMKGTIYKISYTGKPGTTIAPRFTPCPALTAPAGEPAPASAKPPEGTNPDAGRAVPPGATAEQVALGDKIYHGQVAAGTCTACHGATGSGTPLGPDLTQTTYMWSDGTWKGLLKTIQAGVPQPRKYRAPMPANGGTQMTPEQAEAVAAYVWSLSHH